MSNYGSEPEPFKLSDIINGVLWPLFWVLLFLMIAVYVDVSGQYGLLGSAWGSILTTGFMSIFVLGIPLICGLLINKWVGGGVGFIIGSLYYLGSAGLYTGYYANYHGGVNFYGDVSMLGYMVCAMLCGYIAGALNNKSGKFWRMVGAGMTGAMIAASIQAFLNYYVAVPVLRDMSIGMWAPSSSWLGIHLLGLNGFMNAFFPEILLGIEGPLIARVFVFYGMGPRYNTTTNQ